KAEVSQSQEVRSNLSLLSLVGQLRRLGTWALDTTGLKSAGQQGFALWVYKTLLPTIWVRYKITRCSSPNTFNICDPPAAGPWLLGGEPNNGFESIGPSPQSDPPCNRTQSGKPPASWTKCNFDAPTAATANMVWGLVSPTCAYQSGNSNTAWTFGNCTLGVDPQASVSQTAKVQSAEEYWNFPTYTGSPCITQSCNGASATLTGLSGAAYGLGQSTASVRLTGSIRLTQPLSLSNAKVLLDRVFYDPAGGGELVRLRPAAGTRGAAATAASAAGRPHADQRRQRRVSRAVHGASRRITTHDRSSLDSARR
ncbi:MAG: hypothetical protein JO240_07465, partial [Solirubrobacterales bacterium]|nr:hypothetical protein [Solirubrobacterales bacterium]